MGAFGEAHNHNIPSGDTERTIRTYLEQGIFYTMIQTNVQEAPAKLKGLINRPDSRSQRAPFGLAEGAAGELHRCRWVSHRWMISNRSRGSACGSRNGRELHLIPFRDAHAGSPQAMSTPINPPVGDAAGNQELCCWRVSADAGNSQDQRRFTGRAPGQRR